MSEYTIIKGRVFSINTMIRFVNEYREPITIDIDSYANLLAHKGWLSKDKKKISVIDVLANTKKYREEYNKIINVDMSYPIIINERFGILDGLHRIAKSYLNKKKTIQAYVIENKELGYFLQK